MAFNPSYRSMGMRRPLPQNPIEPPREAPLPAAPPGTADGMPDAGGYAPIGSVGSMLPTAPVGSAVMGGSDGTGPDQGYAMGREDTGQGTNPWGARMQDRMQSSGGADDLRRRRLRAAAGGIGGGLGGGFADSVGTDQGSVAGAAPMVRVGAPTFQQRTPSLATATRQQMPTPIAAAPVGTAGSGEPTPLPLPTFSATSYASEHPWGVKPSPSQLQSGGTSPIPVAPAPSQPTPIQPAPVQPTPIASQPISPTARGGIRLKNGGRARMGGLGKSVGAPRAKRSPVTVDVDGNVLMANGGPAYRVATSNRRPFEDYGRLGATDSASRWLNGIGQDMMEVGDPSTWNFGNGARDPNTLVNRELITQDAQGRWVTPRYNIRGNFENESQFGGRWHNQMYATLAALAAGGVAAGALGAGTEAGLAGTGAYDAGAFAASDMGGIGAGAGSGVGTYGTGATMESLAGADAVASGPGNSYWDMVADNGGVANDAGLGSDPITGEPFEAGYPDSGPQNFTGDPPGGIDINGPETGGGGGAGPGGGSSGVDPSGRGLFSRVSDWARANPTSAVRAATGLASAFGSRGTGAPQVTIDGGGAAPVVAGDASFNPTARGGSSIGATRSADVDPGADPMGFLTQMGSSNSGSSIQFGPQSIPRSDYVQKLLDEAEKVGSPEEQEAAAGRAAVDAAQRNARAKEAMQSRMIAQGINPDDPRGVAGEAARLSELDNAKLSVGSQNVARNAEKEKGFSRRAAAAGIAMQDDAQRARATQETQRMIAGANASEAANSRAQMELRARLAENATDRAYRTRETEADRAWRTGESQAGRSFTSGENAADRNLRAQQINAGITQQNNASNANRARNIGYAAGAVSSVPWGSVWDTVSGWAAADGGRVASKGIRRKDYAEGGDVEGPGSSTSDSIPAKLSDGEFVMNAEGVELLDKLAPGFLEKANDKGLRLRQVRQQGLRRAA